MNNSKKEEFDSMGYILIKSAISDEIRDFITQYALFDEMQDFKSEEMQNMNQVPNAHSKYADPAMETLLINLQEKIENHIDIKLFPTYSFYRIYRSGDILNKHIDRPSCEISATICLNYSYDEQDYVWPLIIEGKEIILEPGDMVLYRGCEFEHWRDKFDPPDINDWHVQTFLHYVDANGIYSDCKFDKRGSVGMPDSCSLNSEKPFKPYIRYLK